MASMALISAIIHYKVSRLICFKLIVTSFRLALFSQVSFSVISFFCRCYFVFSICVFSLGVLHV